MASRGKEKDRDALRLFADELKAYRLDRGWTQADLAERVHYSERLVAQVEGCHKAPSRQLARELDLAFKTPGYTPDTDDGPGGLGTFGRMERRIGTIPFPPSFRSFQPHEEEAIEISTYEHSLVPGLLQTTEYMRWVLQTKPRATEEEIKSLIDGRLARQKVLTRSDPESPMLIALIDEGALRRPVAPPEVMSEQIEHLIEMSHLPNVMIQVLPYSAGGHIGLAGAFSIAELDSGETIVNVEDIVDGRVSNGTTTVREVTLRFRSLQSEALPRGASRDLMESVRQEWKDKAAS
jgi:transcriptional regulator with XRE-family HTH domain